MGGFNPLAAQMDNPAAQDVPGAAPPDPTQQLEQQSQSNIAGAHPQQPQQQAPLDPADAPPPQPPSPPRPQGGLIKQLLSNFFAGAGDAMMHHVGLPTPEEQAQQEYHNKLLAYNAQQIAGLRQAQAAFQTAKAGQTENVPKFTEDMVQQYGLPLSLIGQPITAALGGMARAGIAQDTSVQNNATNNATRRELGDQANATKLTALATNDAYKRYAADLAAKTRIKTAGMSQGKAPAAMMQTATFAQSGLNRLQDAEGIFKDLKQSGVLGSVTTDKMEDWIFGHGLIDPSLPPETRYKIGQLRTALGLAGSAMVRAHTGRTSQEIYRDIKGMVALNQGSDALEGSIDESKKMLNDYAYSASDAAVHGLRTGVPASAAAPSSQIAPRGAKGYIVKNGKRIGYVDAQGARVEF